MKLNVGRTLLLGFGFFGVSIITGINKSYVGPFLGTDFGLRANVGMLLVSTVALALFRTPVIVLMPDITPSPFRSQANGLINLMGGIGGILAFALGAYLYGLNRALPFFAAAVALVLACAGASARSPRRLQWGYYDD